MVTLYQSTFLILFLIIISLIYFFWKREAIEHAGHLVVKGHRRPLMCTVKGKSVYNRKGMMLDYRPQTDCTKPSSMRLLFHAAGIWVFYLPCSSQPFSSNKSRYILVKQKYISVLIIVQQCSFASVLPVFAWNS